LGDTNFDIRKEEKLLSAFLGWQPAGIVVTGRVHTSATLSLLAGARAPVVETWCLKRKPFDHVVGFSNYRAARAMAYSLAEWGYRKIAFVYVDARYNDRSLDRRAGYRSAVKELGVPVSPQLEEEVPFGMGVAREAVHRLLAREPDLDAIMCASDTLAVGVLMECLRSGKKVPQDIAVSGFGDVELAAELVPSLTTVQLPRREIGKIAGEILLASAGGGYQGPSVVDCGFSIVRRESA
jgi:LacI family gluconate utilization system Gnt-I transcriptional repressor